MTGGNLIEQLRQVKDFRTPGRAKIPTMAGVAVCNYVNRQLAELTPNGTIERRDRISK